MKKKITILLIILYLCFLVQGLNDGVLGVAWPEIRQEMALPLEYAGFLTIVAFTSYSIVSSQFGKISKFIKPQKIALGGIFLMVIANFGFFIAPLFFLLIIFIGLIAAGQALIESSISSFLAKHFTARHITWGLCFWGMGASISPLIMSQIILFFNWRFGYLAIVLIQAVIGFILYASIKNGIWIKDGVASRKIKEKIPIKINLSYQLLQMSIFFIFTGTQTAMGFWVHSVMLESRGLSVVEAGLYPALFFGFIMIGRIIFGSLAGRLSNMWLIRIGLCIALIGIMILILRTNIFAIMLIGFGLSPVYPCLIHETTRRFNPQALDRQMGFQLSAAGFGEIISFLMGFILAIISLEFLFPIVFALLSATFIINEILELQVIKKIRKQKG